MRFVRVMLLVVLITGCGSNEVSVKINAPPPAELLKNAVSDIAAKGEPVGSAAISLQQHVIKIGKSDPTKANALAPLVESLLTLKGAAKIKAKANEILKML